MNFRIRYGLGGGFGGCGDWEYVTAYTSEHANAIAEELAIEEYNSYGEMHGLFNYEDFMEENRDATDEDAEAEREDDIQSWIEYEVEEII